MSLLVVAHPRAIDHRSMANNPALLVTANLIRVSAGDVMLQHLTHSAATYSNGAIRYASWRLRCVLPGDQRTGSALQPG
jgi:hypothetical protein